MRVYVDWIKGLKGNPVFVAYSAGFNFLFLYWHLMRFFGESPVMTQVKVCLRFGKVSSLLVNIQVGR